MQLGDERCGELSAFPRTLSDQIKPWLHTNYSLGVEVSHYMNFGDGSDTNVVG